MTVSEWPGGYPLGHRQKQATEKGTNEQTVTLGFWNLKPSDTKREQARPLDVRGQGRKRGKPAEQAAPNTWNTVDSTAMSELERAALQ